MSLLQYYEQEVVRGHIQRDSVQCQVIEKLQDILDELTSGFRWFAWTRRRRHGLYLYGPVGIGKTYLMDLFYTHVPLTLKARFHFHHFMQEIDQQLRAAQGIKNPVKRIAMQIAKTIRVLCLDEFFVSDVADASILAELLGTLFQQGVILVVTSNTAIENLYLNGLHRERFLPAIALLKKHCLSYALHIDKDYRMGRVPLIKTYFYPLTKPLRAEFKQHFLSMAGALLPVSSIEILERSIPVVHYGERVVWFTFDALCYLPRCPLDYLEISQRFNTIFLSDIPALSEDDNVRVTLLIALIDVLYDRGIRLIILAAVPLTQLYRQGPLFSTFQRTLSRLEEMQSVDYASRHEFLH